MYYAMIPCCAICFLVSVALIRNKDLVRGDEQRLKLQAKEWLKVRSKKSRDDEMS